MNPHASSRKLVTLCAALLSLAQGTVHADDTEIFLATPPATVNTRPNILFIIDTSGSMDTMVETQVPYDPGTKYDGSCDAGRVYWRTTNTNALDCDGNIKNQWVTASNFVCKTASDVIAVTGFKTQGSSAQWDGRDSKASKHKWKGLTASFDSLVDCKEDDKIPHGDGTSGHLYAADASNGPFSSDKNQEIGWNGTNGTNGTYTFYSGNWVNWRVNANKSNQTRLEIVQDVAKKTLDSLTDVNVGLMRYSTNGSGGMVVSEMEPIENVITSMKAQIDGFTPSGNTPLSETMYEAYRYFTGGDVKYGLKGKSSPVSSIDKSTIDGLGLKYKSPIGSACQKNFIIFLTDGEPNKDNESNSDIVSLISPKPPTGLDRAACSDNGADGNGDGDNGDGKCFDDLAKYMYQTDFFKDANALPGGGEAKENIVTYTIGFGNGVTERGKTLLRVTAEGDNIDTTSPTYDKDDKGGGGKFYTADDTAGLTEAFQNIIQFIVDDNVSFTAPTVSVNAFNRTQNLNDLFITVFGPSKQYHWPGNLKKYRLLANGKIVDSSVPAKDAVDETKGFFALKTRSFWSDADDGPDVDSGGAAHKLASDSTKRNVFTDVAAIGGGAKDLSDPANALAIANTAVTKAMLGMAATTTDLQRDAMIKWARGADVSVDVPVPDDPANPPPSRFEMGDPLHARPVSVIYGGTTSAKSLKDAVVFAATNDGYLHAIDPENGTELWTFVPSELLPKMNDLYQDDESKIKHYGLDGNLQAFKLDRNNDGVVSGTDKVYLFFGMGRGGSNYYALDVTDKNHPQLMWRHGAGDTLIGLGQSWSTPVITRINVASSAQDASDDDKLVLVIGGGYDPTQDAPAYNTDDTGNRVFIIDAKKGDLLWHGGPTNVTGLGFDGTANFTDANFVNSIPGDVRVLDMTNDGFADRMYFADTGGQLWRLDIDNGKTAKDLVTGGVMASLGGGPNSGSTAQIDARRFYSAPDVALLKANNQSFLNIALGSGYRGHPLNTQIEDHFYSIRDYQVSVPFTKPTLPIKDGDLLDITSNLTPTLGANSKGWRLKLNDTKRKGEKVLAEANTFAGTILFTTFMPSSSSFTSCTAKAGTNSLYAVAALDGKPFADRDGDGDKDAADRSTSLDQHGIAPEAVILFPSPDDPANCRGKQCSPPPVCIVGVESCGIAFGNDPVKTFWMQKDAD